MIRNHTQVGEGIFHQSLQVHSFHDCELAIEEFLVFNSALGFVPLNCPCSPPAIEVRQLAHRWVQETFILTCCCSYYMLRTNNVVIPTLVDCAIMELLLDTRLEAGNLPESWLAILLNVTEDDRIWTSPLSRKISPSVTYFSSESLLLPKGFLMVKLSTYFSSGSSREPTLPSSHSRYSIRVGKILDTLAILQKAKHAADSDVFYIQMCSK